MHTLCSISASPKNITREKKRSRELHAQRQIAQSSQNKLDIEISSITAREDAERDRAGTSTLKSFRTVSAFIDDSRIPQNSR